MADYAELDVKIKGLRAQMNASSGDERVELSKRLSVYCKEMQEIIDKKAFENASAIRGLAAKKIELRC